MLGKNVMHFNYESDFVVFAKFICISLFHNTKGHSETALLDIAKSMSRKIMKIRQYGQTQSAIHANPQEGWNISGPATEGTRGAYTTSV